MVKKESWKKLAIVGIFAAAMAFLEAVIVVYLRKIYYPQGFNFPLTAIETWVLNVEWVREFFTIVMLICIGLLAGKTFYEKFSYFLYNFAMWDIFYYIWIKVILNWPTSLLTWDLLFLIPWPWAAPVITPIIYSVSITILALCIIHCKDKNYKIKLSKTEWTLFIVGSAIILYTFLYDYGQLIFKGGFASGFLTLATNESFSQIVFSYAPSSYNWILFVVGEILIFISIFSFFIRTKKNLKTDIIG
ncbi:hypothetical protein HYV49_05965 [Candidatus Pacearchaeota archaeon]|nr:hypothetical protein [Candidatus Pacearchaeota archaeon]